jgi:hypothetical protein
MKIDTMEAYWYRIKTDAGLEGWSYGAFLDIQKYLIKRNFKVRVGLNRVRPRESRLSSSFKNATAHSL